jgi:hypothetical protein
MGAMKPGKSRQLAVVFLAVLVPAAATLVWLGLRLLEQDRILYAQRVVEQLRSQRGDTPEPQPIGRVVPLSRCGRRDACRAGGIRFQNGQFFCAPVSDHGACSRDDYAAGVVRRRAVAGVRLSPQLHAAGPQQHHDPIDGKRRRA